MRLISRLFLCTFILLAAVTFKTWPHEAIIPSPPPTRSGIITETLHGIPVIDPYRWLEEQKSPETRKWIETQNNYTKSLIETIPWRKPLKQKITGLLKTDSISAPVLRNNRYFFTKRSKEQDLSIIYLRKGESGQDEVLIDPHPLSKDHTTSVTLLGISPDGALGAYGIRQGGEDELTPHLFDVDNKKNLPDTLTKQKYWDMKISPDKQSLYYTVYTKNGPRIYHHTIGTDSQKDKEIFGQDIGQEKGVDIDLSSNGKHLLITVSHGWGKSDLYVLDLTGNDKMTTVMEGKDARFEGKFAGDKLFVFTNWNAPKGEIFEVCIACQTKNSNKSYNNKTGCQSCQKELTNVFPDKWKLIVPETNDAIENFYPAGGKIIVSYVHNAATILKLFNPDGTVFQTIMLPTAGSVDDISSRWENKEWFFNFNSFYIPAIIYRHNMETLKQDEWARVEVPLDIAKFEVKQIWYSSKDGTKIPMFLAHRKDIKLDGSNPTLLTGYGGFNSSITPWFSPKAALWVEHGGVFALPNLRGGGEFGEMWHRSGMLDKKQNVFNDFLAAAEWLVTNGYTQPSKLAISGGSNGGLLVGAAMTQRPELFGAVVCAYPLLDMIRYHKFLVAKLWVPEYGSSEDPKQFKYLYAYSPYHQVKTGVSYPATLLITGDSDTRVDPLHARKMVARLQAATSSLKPVLLHYDTKTGHSGGLPVSKRIEDLTDELTFLFWQLRVPFNSFNDNIK